MKAVTIKKTGHVTRVSDKRCLQNFKECVKEGDVLEGLGVYLMIILKLT